MLVLILPKQTIMHILLITLLGGVIEKLFLVTNNKQGFELKHLASNSVGINNHALSIQIKMTIELIELLETQIKDIERQVSEFIKKSDNVITTIPGIGDITATIIIFEIGNFNVSSTRMSK